MTAARLFNSVRNLMAKKTYRTFYLKGLQIVIKDEEGKRVEIVFRGGIHVDSTARFTTSDDKIQQMLEKSSGFGRDYYLESVLENKPAQNPEPVAEKPEAPAKKEEKKEVMAEVKGSERFRNLVEMKNRMAELGIALEEGANYAQAKASATKAGYDFQIKK